MVVDPKSSWLSTLVAPLSVDEFLSSYWRRQHLFSHGAADRFSGLLSWTTLNQILAHHWREPFRFRLAYLGRDLESGAYADLGGEAPRIRANDVTAHLRRGATLSFEGIDEVHQPLTRVAESFEALFRGSIQINIYAAWRGVHGLDLHRDDEEVFILQIDGRKRWLVYGFSVQGVDRGELQRSSQAPAGALLDQVLEPGDLLYIPQGCYHIAVPMNEPVLHLTVGVKDPGCGVRPRPSFNLPWSATAEGLPPGRDFVVSLTCKIEGLIDADPGARSLELRSRGRTYRFPRSMQPIVEQLEKAAAPLPFERLVDAVAGRLDEAMVRMLLAMLMRYELIAIRG